jgi:hypothetical protein
MQKGKYRVVVAQPDLLRAVWEWEVYRDGAPLPARLREGGFNSQPSARTAGRAAFRAFLIALRFPLRRTRRDENSLTSSEVRASTSPEVASKS